MLIDKNTDDIISIKSLSRDFGGVKALDNISLQVKKGQVFGIVGENGAGKTTIIKHILGIYKAQQGSVTVFGRDPVKQPELVLADIGYMSEEPDFPSWMTVSQFAKYMGAFYKGWDQAHADELIAALNLNRTKKLKDLSKGQRAQVGLCCAQAFRPQLLLLDEPSSGLDPVVRMQILDSVAKTVKKDRRTVIFSSHLLEEVERICDHIVMINEGNIVFCDSMENILSSHFQLDVKCSNSEHRDWYSINGVLRARQMNEIWRLDYYGDEQSIRRDLVAQGIEITAKAILPLNDIFLSRSEHRCYLKGLV